MEFRIADTFTDSSAKLTSKEQKTIKTTAFDMQMNPGEDRGPMLRHSTSPEATQKPASQGRQGRNSFEF